MTEAKKKFLAMMVRLGKISAEEYESVTGEPYGLIN